MVPSADSVDSWVGAGDRWRRSCGKIGVKNDGRGSVEHDGVGGMSRPVRTSLVMAKDNAVISATASASVTLGQCQEVDLPLSEASFDTCTISPSRSCRTLSKYILAFRKHPIRISSLLSQMHKLTVHSTDQRFPPPFPYRLPSHVHTHSLTSPERQRRT